MKLNRKGFTLVELLVVIIILLAIMLVALPNINNTLEKSKNKDNSRTKELIESAASVYANDMGITNGNILLSDMVNSGYLTKKEANNCPNDSYVECTVASCILKNCD